MLQLLQSEWYLPGVTILYQARVDGRVIQTSRTTQSNISNHQDAKI